MDNTLKFDPNIFLPDDLNNSEYVETDVLSIPIDTVNEDGSSSFQGDYVDEFDIETYLDSEIDSPNAFQLGVPNTLVVVSPQVIRTAPDGRQVVDVTIEVQDIPNALNYQIRLTK